MIVGSKRLLAKEHVVIARIVFTVCLLISLSMSGCSRRNYEGPERFPLKGKVTVDGVPIDYGTISFLPPAGTDKENRVSGGPIVSGLYDITEAQGANKATYRVEIRWQKPTGKKVREIDSSEMVDQRAEGLPAKYHSESTLSVDVPSPDNTYDFDLSTK